MNQFFIVPETGQIVCLGAGNRLTFLEPLFITDKSEKGFTSDHAEMVNAPGKVLEVVVEKPKRAYKKRAGGGPAPKKALGRGMGVRHCKTCGKEGHQARTCLGTENEGATPDVSAVMDGMRFKAITPEKLHTIKKMLEQALPYEDIAEETGLEVDRIEKIAGQLNLTQ